MPSIFGDIEQLAADLYPYRWPITAALIAVALFAAYAAHRRGLHLVAWRHRLATAAIVAVVLAVAIPTGDYLLSPLWERSHLEEASPLASAAGQSPTAVPSPAPTPGAAEAPTVEPTPPPFAARVTHGGKFHGADDFHFGRGKALLIETAPDAYTLRFEEFSVRNGPDLFVYLSPDPDGYGDGALNLGGLKATDGAFNYEVPAGTDISQFKSAVVWCRQFSVLFATATLVPAA
ncbi:MAG TPA: DM13 domain-containing protein [Dehalococcoidia bacterium]|nr:DM13 domain-containing protein [Dehalococcoidia bacterium]